MTRKYYREAASTTQAAHAKATARTVRYLPTLTFIGLLLLLLAGLTLFGGWVFLQRTARLYQGHIYPNVFALGIDLGGASPSAAEAALRQVATQADTGILVLTDNGQQWSYAWSEVGLQVDAAATAQAAYEVGRGGGWQEQLSVWLRYHEVAPRFAFDEAAARARLAELGQEASQPPVDPAIALENGAVVVLPGEAGRVLDVTTTLARLRQVSGTPYRVEVPLAFQIVKPPQPDTSTVAAQAEALLSRSIAVQAYDVLAEQTLTWNLGRQEIARWLHLVPGVDGEPVVDVNLYAIPETLERMAKGMGDGRGFRYDEAAEQIFNALDAGQSTVTVYLTHPERTYTVVAGDTLTSIARRFGMPPGLVAAANAEIDINRLSVGQQVRIPPQDVLTPYLPVAGKKIVVDVTAQRVRAYENGTLLWDWPASTGLPDSPTAQGLFQVLSKEESAYASQWDLTMPYFIGVYEAGGGVVNGFHELPILANGQRLWAGSLGRPASYGCIILGIPEAQTLYEWAEIGTLVRIK